MDSKKTFSLQRRATLPMLDAKRERFLPYADAIKLPTTDERDLPSKRDEQQRTPPRLDRSALVLT